MKVEFESGSGGEGRGGCDLYDEGSWWIIVVDSSGGVL